MPDAWQLAQQHRTLAISLAAASAALFLLFITRKRKSGVESGAAAREKAKGSKFRFPDTAIKPPNRETIEEQKPTPIEVDDETPGRPLTPRSQAEEEKKLGNQLYSSRNFAGAIKAYTKAHELDPNNLLYLLNRAAATLESGDMQACLADCAVVIEREKKKEASDAGIVAKAMARMGAAYQRLGLLREAYTAYGASLQQKETGEVREKATAVLRRLQEEAGREERERETAAFEASVAGAVAMLKQGPEQRGEAVRVIARAVRGLTDAVNGLQRLQRLIPELIFADVIRALDKDEYFEDFPPAAMQVRVKPVEGAGRGLFAARGVKSGAAAVREKPFVALVVDERADEFCAHCLRPLQAPVTCPGCERERYCGAECLKEAHEQYHGLLCVPASRPPEENAVEKLRAHCVALGRRDPLMALRVLARLFLSGRDFSKTWEHLDHLAHFSFPPEVMVQFEPDRQLVLDVFRRDAPQILDFVTPERYAGILSKALFNCIPVVPPTPAEEAGRPPAPGDRAVKGFALFFAAAYANHSCTPSAAVDFPDGDATVQLVALRLLAAGEEITRAYLPVAGKTAAERQRELKASCSFECACPACARGVDL